MLLQDTIKTTLSIMRRQNPYAVTHVSSLVDEALVTISHQSCFHGILQLSTLAAKRFLNILSIDVWAAEQRIVDDKSCTWWE